MNRIIPPAVQLALDHVRTHLPQVTRVAFDAEGHWLYMDAAGNAPSFEGLAIDVSVLEDASDAVDFPSEFEVQV